MQKECWNGTVISDVNAYKDYLMMVNATPVLVRLVREVPKDRSTSEEASRDSKGWADMEVPIEYRYMDLE